MDVESIFFLVLITIVQIVPMGAFLYLFYIKILKKDFKTIKEKQFMIQTPMSGLLLRLVLYPIAIWAFLGVGDYLLMLLLGPSYRY